MLDSLERRLVVVEIQRNRSNFTLVVEHAASFKFLRMERKDAHFFVTRNDELSVFSTFFLEIDADSRHVDDDKRCCKRCGTRKEDERRVYERVLRES